MFKEAAWRMREEPTKAEKRLWEELRLRRLGGFRFRRQHVIGRFIADFYCHETRLIVEVDGSSHDYREAEDLAREACIKSLDFIIIRFTNEEVLFDLEKVKERILAALNSPLPPKGEGP